MEDFNKDWYKSSAFNLCKRQEWPVTSGKPMKMHTRPKAQLVYNCRPTKVPLHFHEEVRRRLERVPVGVKDSWCVRMVIQPKKNGRARRTIDLSGLSKAATHESHHTRSAAEIAMTVPAGKLKTTLDCIDGFRGVELAEEDRHKTTFSTEWAYFDTLKDICHPQKQMVMLSTLI